MSGAVVLWNGTEQLPTTYETTTELLATVSASNIATQGTIPIVVTLPGQTQGNEQSNIVSFTITAAAPCTSPPTFNPNISGMSELSGKAGDSITIGGSYFGDSQGTSTLTFHGTAATVPANTTTTTNWSATSITTTVPTGVTTGPVVVTVGGVPSNGVIFTVTQSGSASSPTTPDASLVSAGVSNPLAANSGSRYVAFVATSSDPSTSGGPGEDKVYLRDTCQGASADCTPHTILASVSWDGAEPNGPSGAPAISADGRFVAFASSASNLVPHDDNGAADIFLRDTCLGASPGCLPATTRVSLGPAELEANGASSSASISADGRFIAFNSVATNLTLDPPAPSVGMNAARRRSGVSFLHDTCFGVTGSCTPSTTRLATSTPPAR